MKKRLIPFQLARIFAQCVMNIGAKEERRRIIDQTINVTESLAKLTPQLCQHEFHTHRERELLVVRQLEDHLL